MVVVVEVVSASKADNAPNPADAICGSLLNVVISLEMLGFESDNL